SKYNKKIEDAEKKKSQGEEKLKLGKEKYSSAKKEYTESVALAEEKIKNGEEEYTSGKKEYEKNKEEAEVKISECNSLSESLNRALSGAKYSYLSGDYQSVLDIFAGVNPYLANANLNTVPSFSVEEIKIQSNFDKCILVLNGDISALTETVNSIESSLITANEKLEKAKSDLNSAKEKLAKQKAEGKKSLKEAKSKLIKSEQELNRAKSDLEKEKKKGIEKINLAREEIESGKASLIKAENEISEKEKDAEKEIEKAEKALILKKNETERELKRAKEKLIKSEETLDNTEKIKWYINDRNDNPGYSDFYANTSRVDAVATIFPVFFLLVAVLICVTTMTRLIDEKRTEIGTLKSLGYGDKAITEKFLIYGLSAGVAGCILGLGIGVPLLPKIIYGAYGIMYNMPDIKVVPNIFSIVLGVIAALICTGAVSAFACVNSLRKTPSSLMRPKAPKGGKRILLERITPIWNKFGFTMKVTLRNLMRYKVRFFMTVLGVAGCTALIVASLGLHDSINDVVDNQYSKIFKYDTFIVTADTDTEKNLKSLTDAIDKDKRFIGDMLCYRQGAKLIKKDKKVSNNMYLFVPQN
ncbi:MAG: FtsX-like permease family protein, partial [Acutalibacteraceae bacterium]